MATIGTRRPAGSALRMAFHAWHLTVHQHQAILRTSHRGERLQPIVHDVRSKPPALQQFHGEHLVHLLVFYHKHPPTAARLRRR